MDNTAKKVILDVLDYLKYQVENDKCTAAELRSLSDNTASRLEVDATIKDLAQFYGKTENDVSTVISRRLSKPKRRVLYNFAWFSKVVPNTWKHRS